MFVGSETSRGSPPSNEENSKPMRKDKITTISAKLLNFLEVWASELIRLIHSMLSSPAFPEISTYDTGFLDIVLVLLNARDHLPAGFLVKLLCGQLLAIVSFASNKILRTNTPSLKLSVASEHDRAEEAPRLLPNS